MSSNKVLFSAEEGEILNNVLQGAKGFEDAFSILDAAMDEEKIPASGLSMGMLPQGQVNEFFTRLTDLAQCALKNIPVFKPICEFLFEFIEWVLMTYLTRNSGGIRDITSINQAWPAEWAQIDSILKFVKKEMEDIGNEFEEAMVIVKGAVSYQQASKKAKALKRYNGIHSKIKPVFDNCLEHITRAQSILETLNPKIVEAITDARSRATDVLATGCVGALGLVAGAGLLVVATGGFAAISLASIAYSTMKRSELRNALAHYNAEVSLIMKIQRMKKQLTEGQSFLEKLD